MHLRRAGSALPHSIALLLLLGAAFGVPLARAQTALLSEVHTIAAATTAVPVEESFSIATGGTYTVTLTDLGAAQTPSAPLASVTLAVTSGETLVGSALVGAGTLTLSGLAPGNYVLHIVGMPGDVPGSGPIGVQVDGPGMTQVASFADTLALPSQALPNGEAVLNDSFEVSTSANYTITLTDLQLPQSLSVVTLLVIAQGAATPVVTLPNGGSNTANVSLTAGVTYRIFGVGAANASANAGLYTAVVTDSGGAVVYGRVVPVGNTLLLGSPTLASGSDTFTLTDLKYPAALTQLGGVVTLNGQVVAQLAAGGSQAFAAVPGTYQVFGVGTAATAAPAAGSYGALIAASGQAPVFAVARAVVAPGGTLQAYSFDTKLAAAGNYTVSLTDFQFPSALGSLGLAAAQAGALLGTPISAAGNLQVGSAAAGPLSLLVFAQPGATADGLFGIDVTPSTGNAVFQVTQAVGGLFTAQQFTVSAAGSYSVTATDLGFPASFTNYDTIVTQGTSQLGFIVGGGTFKFQATPGDYIVNFIAEPSGPDQAGTYALDIVSTPAAPTVTFSADHTSVTSGSTVDLIWSSSNATSCTASGGWSGAQKLSGTTTSAALTANTTFTLACTGAGGTTSQSVTVTVTAASGGGGGSLDRNLLLALVTLVVLRGGMITAGPRIWSGSRAADTGSRTNV